MLDLTDCKAKSAERERAREEFEWFDPRAKRHDEALASAVPVLLEEIERLRAELDRCAAWLKAIRRIWKRWDDVLSVSGKPSCTEQADAWLAAQQVTR